MPGDVQAGGRVEKKRVRGIGAIQSSTSHPRQIFTCTCTTATRSQLHTHSHTKTGMSILYPCVAVLALGLQAQLPCTAPGR